MQLRALFVLRVASLKDHFGDPPLPPVQANAFLGILDGLCWSMALPAHINDLGPNHL